jgi:hypothetical protein
MNKLTQWIIIWLLTILVILNFISVRQTDQLRWDIDAMITKLNDIKNIDYDMKSKQIDIWKDVRELKDVLLDDFSYYMKQILNK